MKGRAAGLGVCFSALLNDDIGPCLRCWRKGALVDGEFASLRLSPPILVLARRQWRMGALLNGEIASLRLLPPPSNLVLANF